MVSALKLKDLRYSQIVDLVVPCQNFEYLIKLDRTKYHDFHTYISQKIV